MRFVRLFVRGQSVRNLGHNPGGLPPIGGLRRGIENMERQSVSFIQVALAERGLDRLQILRDAKLSQRRGRLRLQSLGRLPVLAGALGIPASDR